MNRALWHNSTKTINKKRYFDPVTLGTMALISGGGALLSGMKKKKQSQDDPLAGIRVQLQNLASGVPALVAERKKQIADRYGSLYEQGSQDIGENIYAERGMGRTSIYDTLKADLMEKLASGQSADELAVDEWGLGRQAAILGQAGSLAGQEQPEEPSMWANLLGQGAGLATNLLGQNWLNEQSTNRLSKILNPKTEQATGTNLRDIIDLKPGSFTVGGTQDPSWKL